MPFQQEIVRHVAHEFRRWKKDGSQVRRMQLSRPIRPSDVDLTLYLFSLAPFSRHIGLRWPLFYKLENGRHGRLCLTSKQL
jgi:hypothetical protein